MYKKAERSDFNTVISGQTRLSLSLGTKYYLYHTLSQNLYAMYMQNYGFVSQL
jgi:hypothetical protein